MPVTYYIVVSAAFCNLLVLCYLQALLRIAKFVLFDTKAAPPHIIFRYTQKKRILINHTKLLSLKKI